MKKVECMENRVLEGINIKGEQEKSVLDILVHDMNKGSLIDNRSYFLEFTGDELKVVEKVCLKVWSSYYEKSLTGIMQNQNDMGIFMRILESAIDKMGEK